MDNTLLVWRDAKGVRHYGDREGWQAEQQRWEVVATSDGNWTVADFANVIARCAGGPIRITVERYHEEKT